MMEMNVGLMNHYSKNDFRQCTKNHGLKSKNRDLNIRQRIGHEFVVVA